MKVRIASLALIGLAACQPGESSDQPEPAAPPPAAATAEPVVQPAAYPEAAGPIANYFRAEMPMSFQGRWAEQDAACAGQNVLLIGATTIASPRLSAELGDVEINEAGGQIIDLVANGMFQSDGQASDGRASMKLSLDRSRLRFFVMGLARDPALPPELVRCR